MDTSGFAVFLTLPSFLAIGISLLLLASRKWRVIITKDPLVTIFFAGLLTLNAVEFLSYSNLLQVPLYFFHIYYVTIIFIQASFISICGQLSGIQLFSGKIFRILTFSAASLLIFLILGGEYIIKGIRLLPYTVTSDRGDYYWLFEIFMLFTLIGGAILMIVGIKNAGNLMEQKRRKVVFISFLPITVSVVAVIILMKLGYPVNFAILSSIVTICFMVVYIYTYDKHDLFRFLVRLPFTSEREAYKKITADVIDYISETQTDNKVSLREFLRQIENSVVSNALELKKGDHSLAAELLKTSTSTIYRHKNKSELIDTEKRS